MKKYMGEEDVLKLNEALAKGRKYTVEEIEAMPENVRVELIDGVIYYQATPSANHQSLLMFLSGTIWSYIRDHQGKCSMFPAPLALYLNQDSETYLEPDLMLVCDDSKIEQNGVHSGPDVVMEIVSPSSKRRDYILKQNKYQKAEVREYWILDPQSEMITIHRFETGMVEIRGFHETIAVEILEGLEIDFSQYQKI